MSPISFTSLSFSSDIALEALFIASDDSLKASVIWLTSFSSILPSFTASARYSCHVLIASADSVVATVYSCIAVAFSLMPLTALLSGVFISPFLNFPLNVSGADFRVPVPLSVEESTAFPIQYGIGPESQLKPYWERNAFISARGPRIAFRISNIPVRPCASSWNRLPFSVRFPISSAHEVFRFAVAAAQLSV